MGCGPSPLVLQRRRRRRRPPAPSAAAALGRWTRVPGPSRRPHRRRSGGLPFCGPEGVARAGPSRCTALAVGSPACATMSSSPALSPPRPQGQREQPRWVTPPHDGGRPAAAGARGDVQRALVPPVRAGVLRQVRPGGPRPVDSALARQGAARAARELSPIRSLTPRPHSELTLLFPTDLDPPLRLSRVKQ